MIALLSAAALGADVSPRAVSILDQLPTVTNATVDKTAEGVQIKSIETTQLGARLKTTTKYKVPLTITAKVKTDSSNITLMFNHGTVSLGELADGTRLFSSDPTTGRPNKSVKAGKIPANQWITITWIIGANSSTIEIDGKEATSNVGDNSGTSGNIGVGTHGNATITVASLTVSAAGTEEGPAAPEPARVVRRTTPAQPKNDPPAAEPKPAAPEDKKISIDVEVSTTPPNLPASTDAPAAVDPDSIDRPEYRGKRKSLAKSVATITAMAVQNSENGDQVGVTHDIIATVNPQSRSGAKAGAGFYRVDGDEMMKTAFQEAVRAVNLRYPYWEPGHIDVSFGEKFTGHGGPSAGTAFAVLMLSTLEGFDIDPKCAVTGDITVDWKVRPVGGVTAKLRGATLDKCLYACIPPDNEAAFTDMPLIFGKSAVYDLQVFAIPTVQNAVAMARKDRAPDLAEAIKLFTALQADLHKSEAVALKNPETIKTLKHILELAPNHLSAKHLLAICDGTAPRTLSSNATIYQLMSLFYPYRRILNTPLPIDRQNLPANTTVLARKRLATLRPIAPKELQPLVTDVSAMIEAMDDYTTNSKSLDRLQSRWTALSARFAALSNDRNFMEKLVHEGY